MRQSESQEEDGPSVHDRLHSAPKGLLRYYILHKIAQRPIHGYEIIQDIDSKTEGAWRPGAGSLYPILKKLVTEGLIKAEPEPSDEATRRVYHASSSNSLTRRTWPLSSSTGPTGNSRWLKKCSNQKQTRFPMGISSIF